jgi:hypothetical protein
MRNPIWANASKLQVLHNSFLPERPAYSRGKRNNGKFVRAISIIKAKIFFRTGIGIHSSSSEITTPFKECDTADDFNAHFTTQGVPKSRDCPGHRICWPFKPTDCLFIIISVLKNTPHTGWKKIAALAMVGPLICY